MRGRIAGEIRASAFYACVGGASGILVRRIPNPGFAQYEVKRLDAMARQMGVDPDRGGAAAVRRQ